MKNIDYKQRFFKQLDFEVSAGNITRQKGRYIPKHIEAISRRIEAHGGKAFDEQDIYYKAYLQLIGKEHLFGSSDIRSKAFIIEYAKNKTANLYSKYGDIQGYQEAMEELERTGDLGAFNEALKILEEENNTLRVRKENGFYQKD